MRTIAGNQFIVSCANPSVKGGDFCCSSNGKQDCCSNLDNRLGLAPSSSSARAAVVSPARTATDSTSSDKAIISTIFIAGSVSVSTIEPRSSQIRSTSSTQSTSTPASSSTSTTKSSSSSDKSQELGLSIGLSVGPVVLFFLLWSGIKYRKNRKRTRRGQIVELSNNQDNNGPANPASSIVEMPGSEIYELPAYNSRYPTPTPAGTVGESTGDPNFVAPGLHPHLARPDRAPSPAPGRADFETSQPIPPSSVYVVPDQNPLRPNESPIPGQHDGASEVPLIACLSFEPNLHERPDVSSTPPRAAQQRPQLRRS
ncbi:MAG: hypothetical protein Q9164_006797 [Protoblastenia rupestris]